MKNIGLGNWMLNNTLKHAIFSAFSHFLSNYVELQQMIANAAI